MFTLIIYAKEQSILDLSPLACVTNCTKTFSQTFNTNQFINTTNNIITPLQPFCKPHGMIYYFHYARGCANGITGAFNYDGYLSYNYNNTNYELAWLSFIGNGVCLSSTAQGYIDTCRYPNLFAFSSAQYNSVLSIAAPSAVQFNYTYQFVAIDTQLFLNQSRTISNLEVTVINITYWIDLSNYTSKPEFSLNITIIGPLGYIPFQWISIGPSPCAYDPANTITNFDINNLKPVAIILTPAVPAPISAYYIIASNYGYLNATITVTQIRVPIVPFSNIFTQWWFWVMVSVLVTTITGTLVGYWWFNKDKDDYVPV